MALSKMTRFRGYYDLVVCGGLKEKYPPWAQVFENFVLRWWCYLGKAMEPLEGGDLLEEVFTAGGL